MLLDEEIKCIFNNKIEKKIQRTYFRFKGKKVDYTTFSNIVMSSTKKVVSKKTRYFRLV